jgi:hypothetical protein
VCPADLHTPRHHITAAADVGGTERDVREGTFRCLRVVAVSDSGHRHERFRTRLLILSGLSDSRDLIMNNVNWGYTGDRADIMAPGETAGDGYCEAGEWGVRAEDVIIYGPLRSLRGWAQSIVAQLPGERGAAEPLVIVNAAHQRAWLYSIDLDENDGDRPAVDAVSDLLQTIAEDPGTAGWELGRDVARLWVDHDHADDLLVGITLASTGQNIGTGQALTDSDFTIRPKLRATRREVVNACLKMISERINEAY